MALACRRFHHVLTAPGLAGLAWEDVEYAADVADQPEFDGFLEWLLRGDAKAPKRLELSFTDEASGEEGQGEEEEPPAPVHSAAWAGLVSAGKRLGAGRGWGWGWELLGSFTAGGLPAAPSARPASSQRLIWPPAFQPAPLGCCRTVTAVRGSLQDLKLDWPHQVELHSWVAGLSQLTRLKVRWLRDRSYILLQMEGCTHTCCTLFICVTFFSPVFAVRLSRGGGIYTVAAAALLGRTERCQRRAATKAAAAAAARLGSQDD